MRSYCLLLRTFSCWSARTEHDRCCSRTAAMPACNDTKGPARRASARPAFLPTLAAAAALIADAAEGIISCQRINYLQHAVSAEARVQRSQLAVAVKYGQRADLKLR